jgi:hypothetical protein
MGLVIAVTLVLLLIVVVVVVGVKLFDLSGRREAKAEQLEERVSRALRRDHRLSRLRIVPVAHVPASTRTPLTIEVVGQVPTREARQAALHVAGQEISRTRSHFRIEDRIDVVPAMRERAA